MPSSVATLATNEEAAETAHKKIRHLQEQESSSTNASLQIAKDKIGTVIAEEQEGVEATGAEAAVLSKDQKTVVGTRVKDKHTTIRSNNLSIKEDIEINLNRLWIVYKGVFIIVFVCSGLILLYSLWVWRRICKLQRLREQEQTTWGVVKYLKGPEDIRRSVAGGFHVSIQPDGERHSLQSNFAAGEGGDDNGSDDDKTSTTASTKLSERALGTSNKSFDELVDKQKLNGDADCFDENDPKHRSAYSFFKFICFLNFMRSMEAGFVSSMMPQIQEQFDLNYIQEGTLAASPDYGLVPGAILCIWTYRHIPWHKYLLVGVLLLSGMLWIILSFYSSYAIFCGMRVLSGVLWSHAGVFFPVWVNEYGPTPTKRSRWMALKNGAMILGILAGYIIGGVARSNNGQWTQLYFSLGIVMAVSGIILIFAFPGDLIKMESAISNGNFPVWELLKKCFTTPPYVFSVLITGTIAGGVVFALYFIAQIVEFQGFDQREGLIYTAIIFVTGPAFGMAVGGWVVGHLGGYEDHLNTFGVASVASIIVFICTVLFPVFAFTPLFVLVNWGFFFAGSVPGSSCYGVAVSVLPEASHVASAVQFAIANTAKVFAPQIGGYICDRMGLLDGFNSTLIVTGMVLVAVSCLGYLYALQARQIQLNEQVGGSNSKKNEDR